MLGTAAAIVGLVGLFAPGLLLARLVRARAPLEAGLLLGHLLLVLVVLLLDAVGAPLRAATVLPALLLVSGGLVAALRREGRTVERPPLLPPGGRAAWAIAGLVTALFALRVGLQPLAGFDVSFRWGWLGERLLERQALDFYPPTTAEQLRLYASPEATPPLVQLGLWLPWACAGEALPRVGAALALLQWAALCSLAARLAARLAPPGAADAAAGGAALLLAACPALLRMVGIGQEAGLTALSLGVAVHALVTADGPEDLAAAGLAGLAAGAGALTREYGLSFPACALLVAAARGARPRALAVLAGASLVAAPWFLRAWWRTGNPVYDFDLLGLFPTNPVHLALLRERRALFALDAGRLGAAGLELLLLAAPALAFGVAGLARSAERRALLPPLLLAAGLYLWAVPNADGGAVYTLRVLAPALVLLAASGGAPAAALARACAERGRPARLAALLASAAALAWCAVWTLTFPLRPDDPVPLGSWPGLLVATRPLLPPPALQLRRVLPGAVPAGARFLSSSVYAHVALHGTAWEVVPVWSPEVRFLFEERLPWAEALARLRARGIVGHVHMSTDSADGWLVTRPFFLEARQHARLVAEVPTLSVIVFED